MLEKDLQYYKSLEYNVIIKKEELDGEKWYVAYCNELGMNACHGIGNTPHEALESYEVEKNAFIEMLYENGEVIPDIKQAEEQCLSGIFTVRTSPWIHSILVNQAKENGVSINCYINQLLAFRLGSSDCSAKIEKVVRTMHSELVGQTNDILKNVSAISYKTNSLFEQSTKTRFIKPSNDYQRAF